jgi:hypothetical protein
MVETTTEVLKLITTGTAAVTKATTEALKMVTPGRLAILFLSFWIPDRFTL